MWQVYLYLANERQNRQRETRARDRRRRWPLGRRDRDARPANASARETSVGSTGSSERVH